MIKQTLITICIMMSAALSLCASAPDFPFVYAEGEATTNVAPDKAIIDFQVLVFDANASNAVAAVQDRSAHIIKFLLDNGITKEDMVSYELSKDGVRRKEEWRELEMIGYNVSRIFKVTINDLSKYVTIGKALFKMDNVVGIESSFYRHDRRDIQDQLLAITCANAKRNAEAMALGFGKELGDVFSISKDGFAGTYANFGLDGYRGRTVAYGHATELEDFTLLMPSTIKIKSYINVIYKLN
jgi:uncharacterized protein YggE